MASHPIGLAAGVMPDFGPEETIEAAARGGFDRVGIWFDPESWTEQTTRRCRRRLADCGIAALDIEPIWLRSGPPDPSALRLLAAGAEVGAKNALLVSVDPDMAANADKLASLCEYAETLDLRVCLEFGLFTTVKTIGMAMSLIDQVSSPAVGLLIDPLHLQRSGGSPEDVAKLRSGLFPYAQFCDASAVGPTADEPDEIIREALDGRLQPGDGELPLLPLLAALPPAIPLSVELRSKALREGWPDPVERARVTVEATRRVLRRAADSGVVGRR